MQHQKFTWSQCGTNLEKVLLQHQKFTWSQCGTNVHVALLWLRFSDRHLAGTITFLLSSLIRTPQKRTFFYCDGFLLEQNRYKQARQHDVGRLDLERLVPLDFKSTIHLQSLHKIKFLPSSPIPHQHHNRESIICFFYLICFDFDRETKETTTG